MERHARKSAYTFLKRLLNLIYWVSGSPTTFDTVLASWYPTFMQSFILSHSSCDEQYGDMSSDTHTHLYTIKPPTAGVRQVGHTSIHFVIKSVLLQLVLLLCALCDCKAMPFVYNIHANFQYNTGVPTRHVCEPFLFAIASGFRPVARAHLGET